MPLSVERPALLYELRHDIVQHAWERIDTGSERGNIW